MVVQDVINRHQGRVLQSHGWAAFRARRGPTSRALISRAEADKPDVIWVHLDSSKAYAQNQLHQTAAKELTQLLLMQERTGRKVVVEGSWSELNWMSMAKYLLGPNAKAMLVHWCGINDDNNQMLPHVLHGVLARNTPVIDAVACKCGKRHGRQMAG